jgi:hypothetical protein
MPKSLALTVAFIVALLGSAPFFSAGIAVQI